ncbi:MAG TPA: hypothetical protein VFV13_01855 [Acidimicrobiia bacterium]|nr:hypothetical protein [Acidimicrobiia bacterium]
MPGPAVDRFASIRSWIRTALEVDYRAAWEVVEDAFLEWAVRERQRTLWLGRLSVLASNRTYGLRRPEP